jgi:cytochrome c
MKKIVIASIAALAAASTLSAGVNAAACTGCHGATFEKKAMGKSKEVSNMTHAEIATALKGYKAGTYTVVQ